MSIDEHFLNIPQKTIARTKLFMRLKNYLSKPRHVLCHNPFKMHGCKSYLKRTLSHAKQIDCTVSTTTRVVIAPNKLTYGIHVFG